MKNAQLVVTIAIAALLASACAGNSTKLEAVDLPAIYTAAALTVEAAATIPVATAMLFNTAEPLPTLTPWSLGIATTSDAAYSSSYASSPCDSSAYVSDVTIADGTELTPGSSFTKTWEFLNEGTCAWNSSYSIVFVSGNDMDGSDTSISQSVSPGATAEISVKLTAPDDDGTYTGYWCLANGAGTLFGEKVYVQVAVVDATATSTPTATSTSVESTSTPTTQPTAVPATDTTAPSETPTSTTEPDSAETEQTGG